jgi:hypothetical protein
MDIMQLTPDQQAAAAPVTQTPAAGSAPADNSAPNPSGVTGDVSGAFQGGQAGLAGASTPSAPAAPNGTPTTPGGIPLSSTDHADKLAAAVAAQGTAGPMGWAKALVHGSLIASAANDVGDVLNGLADSANVQVRPGQSGALAGVTQTLAARQQRIAAAKQQAIDNQFKTADEQRKQAESEASIAHMNVLTVVEQQNANRAARNDQEHILDASVDAGQKAVKAATENGDATIADGITQQQLLDGIKSKQYDPLKYTAYASGYQNVLGKDGEITKVPTFSVVELGGHDYKLTQDQADYLNKYGHSTNAPLPADTVLNSVLFHSLWTQAQTAQTTQDRIEQDAKEAEIKKLDTENKLSSAETQKQRNSDIALLSPALGKFDDTIVGLHQLAQQTVPAVDPKTGQKNPNAGASTAVAEAAQRQLNGYDSADVEKHVEQEKKDIDAARKETNQNSKNAGYTEETVTTTDANGNERKVTRKVPNQPNNGNTQGGTNGGGSNTAPTKIDTTNPAYQKALQIALQHPDQIDNAPFSPEMKDQLKKDLVGAQQKQTQQQTATALSQATPDQVVMQGPNGAQVIPNNPGIIANFIQTHPGYKNLGAGTKQVQPPQQFGSK